MLDVGSGGVIVSIGDRFAASVWLGVEMEQGGADLLKGGRAPSIEGKPVGGDIARLRGIASVDIEDRQGDSVAQDGLDFSPFLAHGYLNDDHGDVLRGEGVGAIIGHPLGVEMIKHKGKPATRLEGVLYLGLPRARKYWDLHQAMQGQGGLDPSQRRSLGLSLQGKVLEKKGRRVTRSAVQHCAVTPWPVNQEAYVEELVKSMGRAELEGAPAVRARISAAKLGQMIARHFDTSERESLEIAREMCRVSSKGGRGV
jgi:hypothetical protein